MRLLDPGIAGLLMYSVHAVLHVLLVKINQACTTATGQLALGKVMQQHSATCSDIDIGITEIENSHSLISLGTAGCHWTYLPAVHHFKSGCRYTIYLCWASVAPRHVNMQIHCLTPHHASCTTSTAWRA